MPYTRKDAGRRVCVSRLPETPRKASLPAYFIRLFLVGLVNLFELGIDHVALLGLVLPGTIGLLLT